jgi:hypothetical protein
MPVPVVFFLEAIPYIPYLSTISGIVFWIFLSTIFIYKLSSIVYSWEGAFIKKYYICSLIGLLTSISLMIFVQYKFSFDEKDICIYYHKYLWLPSFLLLFFPIKKNKTRVLVKSKKLLLSSFLTFIITTGLFITSMIFSDESLIIYNITFHSWLWLIYVYLGLIIPFTLLFLLFRNYKAKGNKNKL